MIWLSFQALLCSKHTGDDLRSHVLQLIEGRPDMIGWDSVWMLCSHVQQTKKVAEFAVDMYPHAVAKLAATTYGRDLEKVGDFISSLVGGCVEVSIVWRNLSRLKFFLPFFPVCPSIKKFQEV